MTGKRLHPTRTSPAEGFGRRLRGYREAAGLSQVALAGDLLHPSYVSQLESGRRAPTEAAVALLAERLQVAPEVLVSPDADADDELAGAVALAEAALGLGRAEEACRLLEPYVGHLGALVRGGLGDRLAHTYAAALERCGRLEAAIGVLEQLVDAAAARGASPSTELVVSLMRCCRDAGDLGRAVDVGEAARARLQRGATPDLAAHAELVSTLAGVYSERGDLVRASLLLDDLMARADRSGTLEEQASAYWNAAITAVERGRADEGLLLCDQATLLTRLGSDLRAQARLAVTQAWVLLAQQPPRAADARALLRDALPRLRQHDTSLSVASAETELARCELLLGRSAVAGRLARSALRRLSTEHLVERARALAALGEALHTGGDSAAGLVSLDESAALLRQAGASRESAAAWRHLSDVHAARGDAKRALVAAREALDLLGLRATTPDIVARTTRPSAPVGPRSS